MSRNLRKRAARAMLLAAGCALVGACAASDGLPQVALKGQTYAVEIADETGEQVRGLMFRRELARDHGMLFVYEYAQPQSFWMRNCYIALDILYFDDAARFINGHYATPPCRGDPCPSYPSLRPARYILELGSGVGRALDLAEGDVLELPPGHFARDRE